MDPGINFISTVAYGLSNELFRIQFLNHGNRRDPNLPHMSKCGKNTLGANDDQMSVIEEMKRDRDAPHRQRLGKTSESNCWAVCR